VEIERVRKLGGRDLAAVAAAAQDDPLLRGDAERREHLVGGGAHRAGHPEDARDGVVFQRGTVGGVGHRGACRLHGRILLNPHARARTRIAQRWSRGPVGVGPAPRRLKRNAPVSRVLPRRAPKPGGWPGSGGSGKLARQGAVDLLVALALSVAVLGVSFSAI